LMLDDAYAMPGIRPPLRLMRGPTLGIVLAVWLQAILGTVAIPREIVFYGSAMSLLLTSAMRVCFPPVTRRLLAANGLDNRPVKTQKLAPPGLAIIAVVVAAAIFEEWNGAFSPRLVKIGMLAVVLLIAYRLSRHA